MAERAQNGAVMSESGLPPGSGAESGPRRWLFWLLVPTLVVLVVVGLRRLQGLRAAPYVPQPATRPPAGRTDAPAETTKATKPAESAEQSAAPAPKAEKAEAAAPQPEQIDLVEVPCLTGQPRQLQEEALAAAGLRVGFTLTRLVKGDAGLVVECQPTKGTRVPVGSRVDLVISVAGSEVGNVVGLSAGAARGRLVRAGFQVKRRRTTAPEGVPVGMVVEQDPKPGKLVPIDSVVTLRVSADARRDDPKLDDDATPDGPES